jgi:hypothetical protein
MAALAQEELQVQTSSLHAQIEQLSSQTAEVQVKAEQQSRAAGLRESVEQARLHFREESQLATALQEQVEVLRTLRTSKLSSLPIEGVEIREGHLLVDGKKFDTQLNLAEQVKVAFLIAAEGAKDNPVRLMVADAGDSLNEENLRWIVDGAKSAGFQVFLTKREEGAALSLKAA